MTLMSLFLVTFLASIVSSLILPGDVVSVALLNGASFCAYAQV